MSEHNAIERTYAELANHLQNYNTTLSNDELASVLVRLIIKVVTDEPAKLAGEEYIGLRIVEVLSEAQAVILRDRLPQASTEAALNLCLWSTLATFTPASKYNGLEYDEVLSGEINIRDIGDMIGVLLEDQHISTVKVSDYRIELDELRQYGPQAE